MLSQINSVGLMGIDGFMVSVQTDVSNGMPAFEIVGLPDNAVREAKERVKAAIRNTGGLFPTRRVIINLAPAALRKEGPSYDLPMAIAILDATEQIFIKEKKTTAFIGELALDGAVHSVSGVLPMVISAYKHGIKKFFVPRENAAEASIIKDAAIYPVAHLSEIIEHFTDQKPINPCESNAGKLLDTYSNQTLDFCDVKGQESAKRALEIAAAGNHNVLMIGSPGTGKTMLAQRMSSILPDMTFDEALEVTKIHSIAGILNKKTPLISQRPFRNPHHTISASGLSGGGTMPRPGELSLAHNGVLFLDELPEFHRDVLEVMRQPLEDGAVTISRVSATLTYPCNIMLIASMNPCKCGYFGDDSRECTCTPKQIQQYRSKISGPLLDRIDIHIEVPSVRYDDLSSLKPGEPSSEIKKRVNRARKIQLERYKDEGIYSNAQLTPSLLQKYCRLGERENTVLKSAFDRLGLSARAHSRILKVARTIADLMGEEEITAVDIAEAIGYRSLDRKYFS